jgi:hypothetical protein
MKVYIDELQCDIIVGQLKVSELHGWAPTHVLLQRAVPEGYATAATWEQESTHHVRSALYVANALAGNGMW